MTQYRFYQCPLWPEEGPRGHDLPRLARLKHVSKGSVDPDECYLEDLFQMQKCPIGRGLQRYLGKRCRSHMKVCSTTGRLCSPLHLVSAGLVAWRIPRSLKNGCIRLLQRSLHDLLQIECLSICCSKCMKKSSRTCLQLWWKNSTQHSWYQNYSQFSYDRNHRIWVLNSGTRLCLKPFLPDLYWLSPLIYKSSDLQCPRKITTQKIS